ncbi:hypothetical protein ACVQ92_13010 [Staphylococcus aureus]
MLLEMHLHLFKVPTDADRLDLQFIPDNTAVADASRITTNKDGYKIIHSLIM